MIEKKRPSERMLRERQKFIRNFRLRDRRINVKEHRKSRNFARTRGIFIAIAILILLWGFIYVIF